LNPRFIFTLNKSIMFPSTSNRYIVFNLYELVCQKWCFSKSEWLLFINKIYKNKILTNTFLFLFITFVIGYTPVPRGHLSHLCLKNLLSYDLNTLIKGFLHFGFFTFQNRFQTKLHLTPVICSRRFWVLIKRFSKTVCRQRRKNSRHYKMTINQ